MLQYQEVLATAALRFIQTLRRLDLVEKPSMYKNNVDEILSMWKYADRYIKEQNK